MSRCQERGVRSVRNVNVEVECVHIYVILIGFSAFKMPRKKRKNVVDPGASSDEEMTGSELSMRGSNVFNSMESLTPSQLDQAIMEMLNIKPKAGIAGICDGEQENFAFLFAILLFL